MNSMNYPNEYDVWWNTDEEHEEMICPRCKGTGKDRWEDDDCERCDGEGTFII